MLSFYYFFGLTHMHTVYTVKYNNTICCHYITYVQLTETKIFTETQKDLQLKWPDALGLQYWWFELFERNVLTLKVTHFS